MESPLRDVCALCQLEDAPFSHRLGSNADFVSEPEYGLVLRPEYPIAHMIYFKDIYPFGHL